ncbi:Gfo/Idh/MocA family protein [Novosphingobium beihaiensis]|uniref:Gfo/Idh/MocA family oxidoreductase n=1 Tax=Novosphingobium beihaiensis TaxID=2930389 RepID=A0ABT0BST1_9SPHN|nr:Gfo/Idh/MocA family oxidoreductase [Novosphingobium beihaiensis]MCJ2188102.1 Gfo/Idh/MocA family oxidoreductase [Novosphingobium beihaiensis]
MVRIGLCGLGYWGKNLFRTLSGNPGIQLAAVADAKAEVREKLAMTHPALKLYADAMELISDPEIDAVVLATPVACHYAQAKAALDRGKHVMVEKPLCTSSEEADDLVARADLHGLTLMADHTFLFHPAVLKLGELVRSGALGQISYFDSQRVNLGLFQPDVNVLWDLAPHDLSIIDYLFGGEPVHIEASGYCHVNPGFPDIAYLTFHYPNSMVAHLNLSWMSPVKVRRVAVGGSDKMVVWDDLDRDEPLKIYDSGITTHPRQDREIILPSYRIGSVTSPRLAGNEPLADVVEHFRQVILGQATARTDGRLGRRIVRTLERTQAALDLSLQQAQASMPSPSQSTAAA